LDKPQTTPNFLLSAPDEHRKGDIQEWLTLLDACLPPHLRPTSTNQDDPAPNLSVINLSKFLLEAQSASHDLFSHLGLAEQRWDAVLWLVRTLVASRPQRSGTPFVLDLAANVFWPDPQWPLDKITEGPIKFEMVQPSQKLRHSLEEVVAAPESIELRYTLFKRVFGQIWRSLGNMILSAVEVGDGGKESEIMAHVLELIAYLHHAGMVPESIYRHQPVESFALLQPPMLHQLSAQIFEALSDASWRAREAAAQTASQRMNASYFLGREIPGSRFDLSVTRVTPEVWLEFVLWSCLHGGWVLDGTAILEQIISRIYGSHPWKLLCWRDFMAASEKSSTPSTTGWGVFSTPAKDSLGPDYRELTHRRISSEVVTAFVDGLVSTMRVGVGFRGTHPEVIVKHIKSLKAFLDMNGHSLGSASWDSIIIRLLDSGGILPEKHPRLLLQLLELSSNFGQEVSSVNVTPSRSEPSGNLPYFFVASAAPIGLLHRALRCFIARGDLQGVVDTLNQLNRYTDNNKKRSIVEFLEKLKKTSISQSSDFTSTFAPIEYPAFYHHLPKQLLAELMEFVTDAGTPELGRSLLFSEDIDGPLISPTLYHDNDIAASIVRFGNMIRDDELVMRVVKSIASPDKSTSPYRLPAEVLTAFLISQVQMHRWEAVQKMQNYVLRTPGYRPRAEVLAAFAGELLRTSKTFGQGDVKQREIVQSAFTDFLFAWEGLILTNIRDELNCILAILTTVHEDWKAFCSPFITNRGRQHVCISAKDFNRILGGVLDAYGSMEGKRIVQTWCHPTKAKQFLAYQSPGGLPTMSRYRVDEGQEYLEQPGDLEVTNNSGDVLILKGRITPNIQTIKAIVRKAQDEENQRQKAGLPLPEAKKGGLRELRVWATTFLESLGLEHEDIVERLGDLAVVSQERPPGC
jgi:hypothetical protein